MATPEVSPAPAIRQIAITSSLDGEETVSALLESLFQTTPSTAIKNGATEAITSIFLPVDDRGIADLKRTIRENLEHLESHGVGIGKVSISIRKIRAQDWKESWKRHFKTIEINERLLVIPPWSRRKAKANQATVVLDPGMSFGTGNHPTTLFCLKQIASFNPCEKPGSCLDIGTGSGILAIAAAKLGFAPVDAFDNDEEAVRSSIENANRNEVSDLINLFQGSLESLSTKPKKKYSVVCANLTHDLLKAHAKRIEAQIESGGLLCLAGILIEQFDAVRTCFESMGLQFVTDESLNEWKSGAFRKPL